MAPTAPANPCGLVAKSFFNDTFRVYNGTNQTTTKVDVNSNGIAWDSDKEYKFKNMDGDWQDYQWMNVTDGKYIFKYILSCDSKDNILTFIYDHIYSLYFLKYRTLYCLDENCWSA